MERLFKVWPVVYVLSIVAVNVGFAYVHPIDLGFGMFAPMALLVGAIFIFRDLAQRDAGHFVLLLMAVGLILSYLLADPYIALASALAFAASEFMDWVVYTTTKRPMRERIIISNAVAIPIDTMVFLFVAGFFTAGTFWIMLASKAVASVIVWYVDPKAQPSPA